MINSRTGCFQLGILLLSTVAWAQPTPEISGIDVVSGKKAQIQIQGGPSATTKDFKASVIFFVSARCPCSASHEQAIRELSQEFSYPGFQFIGVHSNIDESLEETKAHFEKSAIPFPIVQDEGAKIANDWGALKTPHVFVVNPKGDILYQGGVDDSHIRKNAKKYFLRDALLAIQEGKKPEISLTRTLGCVIAR